MTFILLPFVIVGSVYIFKHKKASEVSAVDLITITYNGNSTPDPVFTLDDLKPGDDEQRCFVVRNVNTTDAFDILMKGGMVTEEKNFADILEIIINKVGGSDIYGGTMGYKNVQDFLDDPNPVNLGNFSAGIEASYCITVKFPPEAGNEYQQAKLVFDLAWWAEIIDNKIPPECRHMTFESIVEGTEGDDVIHTSTRTDLILAKGGNDNVRGSSGSDCLVGGDGDDYLEEESGNGVILGGNGNDTIDAGTDNDTVYGGAGNDTIETGTGADLIYGDDGDDTIYAGIDDDRVYGGGGNDYIEGGDNNDELYGGDGNDTIIGKAGDDKIYGESGNDTIEGNTGNDHLDGGADSDNLVGNTGIDTCTNGETVDCEL